MLTESNSILYSYPITRDYGFAPNPFHGVCTLATCKPRIRKAAKVGDWVMGVGGSNLKLVKKKCIFLMKVTEKISFQEYWDDSRFSLKKPSRNGSRVQMLGDNIYHQDVFGKWIQEDSHHSNPDGTPNLINLERDAASTDQILLSDYFLYFGSKAIDVNLESIGYTKIRDFKKTRISATPEAKYLIESIFHEQRNYINQVISDPCQFMSSHHRVNQGTGKVL